LKRKWQAPFVFIPVLSEEPFDSQWRGARGWVTDMLSDTLVHGNVRGHSQAYLCGPPPMIDAAIAQTDRAWVAARANFL
jgi:p-cymene monooxygenase electron transfer component